MYADVSYDPLLLLYPVSRCTRPTNDLDVILMDAEDLFRYTIDLAGNPAWHNKLCHVRNLRPNAGAEMRRARTEATLCKPHTADAADRWAKIFAA